MTKGLAGTDVVRRLRALLLFGVLLGVAISGCAGPPKQEYVLRAATAPKAASAVQTALPIVQIERVLLPDYLDTRDILTRRDGRVEPSESARWAERLSVGMTRALAMSLATQLTGIVVTSAQPLDPPVLRVLVDVIAFELTGDRQVVLAARWTFIDGTGRRSLAVEQTTLTEPVAGAVGRQCHYRSDVPGFGKIGKSDFGGYSRKPGSKRRSRLAFVSKLMARQFPFVVNQGDGG